MNSAPHSPRYVWLRSLVVLPPGVTWSTVGFAVRTTAASLVALYLAFLMNFDDPKWAAMTVWIVAQGSRGMSVSKGKYRFAGTLIGAAVGVTLMGPFPQTPEIALPLLALWLGLCTALSTGLRNFRSYGAVLAGYTAVIVVMDSVSSPGDVFNIAVARVSYIGLGIVTEAVFAMIFVADDPIADVRARLSGFVRQSAALSALALRQQNTSQALHKLFASAIGVDSAAEYAAAVSAQLRRRMGHLQTAVIASLLQLSAARALRNQLAGDAERHEAIVDEAAALLDHVATASGERLTAIAALNSKVDALLRDEIAIGHGTLSKRALLLYRLQNLMTGVERALASEALLSQANAGHSRIRFSSHIDHTAAFYNGLRASAALLAAIVVWVTTAWTAGTAFVTVVGVVAALFAARPNPIAGGVGFLKGACISVVIAGICNFAILPAVTDFVPLALVLAVCLISAGLAMSNPKTALPATGFAIFFLDLVGPDNVTRADPSTFFNGCIALLLGIGIGTLIFALILPVDVAAVQRRLVQAVRNDLAAIGRNARRWSVNVWVSRTADRIERRLLAGGEQSDGDLRGMLAMLGIGCAAIELTRLLPSKGGAHRSVNAVMRALANLDPGRLVRTARLASNRLILRAVAADAATAKRLLRGAALLRDIEHTTIAFAGFMRAGAAPVIPEDRQVNANAARQLSALPPVEPEEPLSSKQPEALVPSAKSAA